MKNILLTGATGFLGGELTKRLLQQFPDSNLYLLLRPLNGQTSEARLRRLLCAWDLNSVHISRIQPVDGNLVESRLGLARHAFESLAERVDTVFHVAASVDLFGLYEKLHRTNLGGAREILGFCETAARSVFRHLHYVSTAYVAGQRRGLILETELAKGQAFNNAYERVKWEAEMEMEAAKDRLPLTVYRPGIIVGDARTGRTPCFNVVYEPLRLMFARKLPFIPNDQSSRLDIVPVNFVADAIAHLATLSEETKGKTFHLTVGRGNGIAPLDLVLTGKQVFDEYRSGPRLRIPPRLEPSFAIAICRLLACVGTERTRRMAYKFATYSRYARYYKDFDTSEAARLLTPAGLVPPSPADYWPVLLRYALEQNFGRPVAAGHFSFSQKSTRYVAQS